MSFDYFDSHKADDYVGSDGTFVLDPTLGFRTVTQDADPGDDWKIVAFRVLYALDAEGFDKSLYTMSQPLRESDAIDCENFIRRAFAGRARTFLRPVWGVRVESVIFEPTPPDEGSTPVRRAVEAQRYRTNILATDPARIREVVIETQHYFDAVPCSEWGNLIRELELWGLPTPSHCTYNLHAQILHDAKVAA